MVKLKIYLKPKAPAPKNGQTHSKDSSAIADELFDYAWPFCEVGAYRVNPFRFNTDKHWNK